jgi:hypothetical protein
LTAGPGRWSARQEQQLGLADQACGQVQAPLHATGVALGRAVRGVDEVELVQQPGGAAAGLRLLQVVEPPDQLEVLPAGQLLLKGRRLAGQADRAAHRGRLPNDVAAVHHRPPRVRQQQRRQDAHRGRLARTVRPEQAQHRPCGTGRSMPRSACTSPNDLANPSTRIAGPELVCDTYPPVQAASRAYGANCG